MRRLALIAMLVLAAAVPAGCGQRYEIRTGQLTLERALSRAFKRNYAAAERMTTGRANARVLRHADVHCTPLGGEPDDDAEPWPWRCRVLWYRRDDPRAHVATYGVRVDERGCFQARSGAFPDRLPDRLLSGRSPDPLVYIRSCP